MIDPKEDQKKSMTALEPFLDGLYSAVEEAVSFYFGKDYSVRARAEHSPRTVANCIYDHAEKLLTEIAEKGDFVRKNINGLTVFIKGDEFVLRVKQVDAGGRSRNYRTKQQQDYHDQKPLPELPDEAPRLTLGYELNAAATNLERVIISREIGKKKEILWAAQIIIGKGEPAWVDIIPSRLLGTEKSDFKSGGTG